MFHSYVGGVPSVSTENFPKEEEEGGEGGGVLLGRGGKESALKSRTYSTVVIIA